MAQGGSNPMILLPAPSLMTLDRASMRGCAPGSARPSKVNVGVGLGVGCGALKHRAKACSCMELPAGRFWPPACSRAVHVLGLVVLSATSVGGVPDPVEG